MEVFLKRAGGAQADVCAEVRRCTSDDLAALFALQNAVRSGMENPEHFLPNNEQELAGDLRDSLCIGVFVDGEPAAYSILRYCGASDHNYANYLGVPKEDIPYWANGDTVVVAPEWRGNRLQQRLLGWSAEQRRPDIVGIGCTVSPDNRYSLENLEAMGFERYARRLMYGEHDRFVMKKQLEPLPGYYRHFKGMPYKMLCMAGHSETQQRMVVYKALYGARGVWVRPAEMWFSHIDRGDYHGLRFRWDPTAAADDTDGQTEK